MGYGYAYGYVIPSLLLSSPSPSPLPSLLFPFPVLSSFSPPLLPSLLTIATDDSFVSQPRHGEDRQDDTRRPARASASRTGRDQPQALSPKEGGLISIFEV